jgi:hypothetical protein
MQNMPMQSVLKKRIKELATNVISVNSKTSCAKIQLAQLVLLLENSSLNQVYYMKKIQYHNDLLMYFSLHVFLI